MPRVDDSQLFIRALTALERHKSNVGVSFKGRFIQLFLALKFFQNNLPSMHSGSFVTTEVLQTLLDDLYAKTSQPANKSVLALFENRFLARTGLIAPDNATPQNTWRNNFNLQKGIGCYAPAQDLDSTTFLDQARADCRHLQPAPAGELAGGRCSLSPSAVYRNESHRKWLRIDPGGNGYSVTDLQRIANFLPYVAPAGQRLPFYPLVVALYFDADGGLGPGARSRVGQEEFSSDFNMSAIEFHAYFDDALSHPLNSGFNVQGVNRPQGKQNRPPQPSPATPSGQQAGTSRPSIPQPKLGTQVPPPNVNSGWEGEQYVVKALSGEGWDAHSVSRQSLGYDVFAKKGHEKRYIEVKSSLGICSPSLTAREWQQAHHHGTEYVLAIIEHFDASGQNTIYWVPNPATNCAAVSNTTVTHTISRSSWSQATVKVGDI